MANDGWRKFFKVLGTIVITLLVLVIVVFGLVLGTCRLMRR
jgi:hypothetical protein